ncbi:MAG: HemK family protein methyltransferase [Candidatus Gracilibacteria bacterium]|nr:HemK family protein methyltransferase [Candidatus Gracilibacteria bacterium]
MKKQELLLIGRKFGLQINIVEKILLKKTGLNKSQFFLSDDLKISEKELEELRNIFRKVVFGYPIEYVLEKAEFYGLDFYVDKRCLIPRNDTEVMVEQAIEEINTSPLILPLTGEGNNIIYIDVGTGSGATPISVVKSVSTEGFSPLKKSFAVDISEDALKVARKNIKTHNLENKIKLLKSDLLSKIPLNPPFIKGEITQYIITANLPYIKDEDF